MRFGKPTETYKYAINTLEARKIHVEAELTEIEKVLALQEKNKDKPYDSNTLAKFNGNKMRCEEEITDLELAINTLKDVVIVPVLQMPVSRFIKELGEDNVKSIDVDADRKDFPKNDEY